MEQYLCHDYESKSEIFINKITDLAAEKRDDLISNWKDQDVYRDLASYLEDMTIAHGYDLIIYSNYFQNNYEKYINLTLLDEELLKTIAINVLDLWLKDKTKINTEA